MSEKRTSCVLYIEGGSKNGHPEELGLFKNESFRFWILLLNVSQTYLDYRDRPTIYRTRKEPETRDARHRPTLCGPWD